MIDKRTFKKAFGGPLEAAGYIRHGQTWYKRGRAGVTAVLELQKDDCRNFYFLNIGFLLQVLDDRLLKERESHIRSRAGRFFPDISEDIIRCCSLDSDDDRSHPLAISRFVAEQLVPRVDALLAPRRLARDFKQGRLKAALVRLPAQPVLLKEAESDDDEERPSTPRRG